jgi:transcriptional regulator with PAS, ATPase and Fis domain
LVEPFLFQLASKLGKPIQVILPDGMDNLLRHDWPGNIRELKNVVERAAMHYQTLYTVINIADRS